MSDWNFWKTGIFEFIRVDDDNDRGNDLGEGKMRALLWQWDEHEKATHFLKRTCIAVTLRYSSLSSVRVCSSSSGHF